MVKQFGESLQADMVHTAYICFFLFEASTEKLFASFHYHVLFFCLVTV